MCVPNVAIREDGRGFMVQKGGVWFDVWEAQDINHGGDGYYWSAASRGGGPSCPPFGYGDGETIMESVDNALAKYEQSLQRDKEEAK